ncbi:hypothetical protein, partial [Neisseria gonorrhoeae]|uniref:hypothetical protein n=1 Tax=Neisseria gonorrhoeae TaxID=485 RepID=UPI001186331A
MPRLAVLSVLSATSSPCPDLNLIHYTFTPRCRLKPSDGIGVQIFVPLSNITANCVKSGGGFAFNTSG